MTAARIQLSLQSTCDVRLYTSHDTTVITRGKEGERVRFLGPAPDQHNLVMSMGLVAAIYLGPRPAMGTAQYKTIRH